jgi:hypothetical protein
VVFKDDVPTTAVYLELKEDKKVKENNEERRINK